MAWLFPVSAAVTGDAEHYITVEAPAELSLPGQLDACRSATPRPCSACGCRPKARSSAASMSATPPTRRRWCARAACSQEPLDSPVAVSLVQQPPLPGGKVAMLAYHLEDGSPARQARRSRPDTCAASRRTASAISGAPGSAPASDGPSCAVDQTNNVFDELIDVLAANGATLGRATACAPGSTSRTWMSSIRTWSPAAARCSSAHGLTRDTHYIASTGIEGACAHRYDIGADGCLFHSRPGARAGVVSERPRPALRDQGLQRHIRARHAHRLRRPGASFHFRHRQHRRRRPGGASWATCGASSTARWAMSRRCCARAARGSTT